MKEKMSVFTIAILLLFAWPQDAAAAQVGVPGTITLFRSFGAANPEDPNNGKVYVWLDTPILSPCSLNISFVIPPDTPDREFGLLMDTITFAKSSGRTVTIFYQDDLDQSGSAIYCHGNRPIIHSILVGSF